MFRLWLEMKERKEGKRNWVRQAMISLTSLLASTAVWTSQKKLVGVWTCDLGDQGRRPSCISLQRRLERPAPFFQLKFWAILNVFLRKTSPFECVNVQTTDFDYKYQSISTNPHWHQIISCTFIYITWWEGWLELECRAGSSTTRLCRSTVTCSRNKLAAVSFVWGSRSFWPRMQVFHSLPTMVPRLPRSRHATPKGAA